MDSDAPEAVRSQEVTEPVACRTCGGLGYISPGSRCPGCQRLYGNRARPRDMKKADARIDAARRKKSRALSGRHDRHYVTR
jgi:hypothetical protein